MPHRNPRPPKSRQEAMRRRAHAQAEKQAGGKMPVAKNVRPKKSPLKRGPRR